MADVFISYSRDDYLRVVPIAKAFALEGLSVWWDPDILPGSQFDQVIGKELAVAKCVIVVWSRASSVSRWVREEASDALARGILIPVQIENMPLPLGFKLVQTEDLTDWNSDRNANSWQRIMLQARALSAHEERQSANGSQSSAADTASSSITIGKISVLNGEKRSAVGPGILTLTAVALLTATWVYGSGEKSSLLVGTAFVAAFTLIMFRFAEDDLNPAYKAIARRWFLPVTGRVAIGPIEAFYKLFEAVFGSKHLSWKCFRRSATASIIIFTLSAYLFDVFLYERAMLTGLYADKWRTLALAAFLLISSNIVGDYVSLWETRYLLKISQRRPSLIIPVVILDALLTPVALVVGFFSVLIPIAIIATLIGADAPKNMGSTDNAIFTASVATAYVTSIWLWLALTLGPVVRFLVWSRRTGLTAIGGFLDAERKPFTALGYVAALVILVAGTAIWGIHAVVSR